MWTKKQHGMSFEKSAQNEPHRCYQLVTEHPKDQIKHQNSFGQGDMSNFNLPETHSTLGQAFENGTPT